eukprot:scaffold68372_cov64-Phaeocystis_antarctica.AAC.6
MPVSRSDSKPASHSKAASSRVALELVRLSEPTTTRPPGATSAAPKAISGTGDTPGCRVARVHRMPPASSKLRPKPRATQRSCCAPDDSSSSSAASRAALSAPSSRSVASRTVESRRAVSALSAAMVPVSSRHCDMSLDW